MLQTDSLLVAGFKDYLDLYLIHFPISLAFVPFEERYPPEWTDKRGNAGHLVLDPVPYRALEKGLRTWEPILGSNWFEMA